MAIGKCQCPDNPFVGPLLVLVLLLLLILFSKSWTEAPIVVPNYITTYHHEKYQNIDIQK